MTKEEGPSDKEAALNELREQFMGNDAVTQRQRLSAAFHRFVTLTTLEIRRFLDILHPAGRVRELRAEGLDIVTLRLHQETEAGVKHSVGMYVLKRGNNAGAVT